MTLFRNAAFFTTVAQLADLPPDAEREIAFAGRSNAGKSSAINTLADHARLAFVSKTPGRTQHLNYFRLAPGKYFVDLPGYGFAKAPEEIRAQWEGLLAPYLLQRAALAGLVLILDSRHPLSYLDRQMLEWFSQTGKPVHVLLSKADKLPRQEQTRALTEARAALTSVVSGRGGESSVQLFSSLSKTGVEEAEAVLGAWLAMTVKKDESGGVPTARVRPGKAARPKNRRAQGWSARRAGK